MPAFSVDEIGKLYDFGLRTRDGSKIPCKNKNGAETLTDSMAFMTSIDKAKPFKESTELQEKQRLIQLGTSTSIDREFEQWVQNTQGDWSGGTGQRVYGKDSIQYFDGEGLVWPQNDYVPQRALPGNIVGLPAAFANFAYNGTTGGFLNNLGQGYAYADNDTVGGNGGNTNVYFRTLDGGTNVVTLPTQAPPASVGILHMVVACGFLWVLFFDDGGPGRTGFLKYAVSQIGMVNGVFVIVRTDNLSPFTFGGFRPVSGLITASFVSNRLYVAVGVQGADNATNTNWINNLYLLDYSVVGAPTGIGAPIDVFPSSPTASSGSPFQFTDLAWQGGLLYVAVSDGFSTSILNIAPATPAVVNTSAILGGFGNAFMASVGADLFLVGFSNANNQINRQDIFILAGGQLTEFGSVTTPVPILDSITSPTAFGSYAIWGVSYTKPGDTTATITVYAFDVVRSRLFRALTFTDPSFNGSDVFAHDAVAVFGATSSQLTGTPASFQAQWGIAVFTGNISSATEVSREFFWGVVPTTPAPTFNGLLQMGVDILSGLFDFTAASNKLFGQVVASFFDGLKLAQPSPSATLNLWFDQDPGQLSGDPDFTAHVSGATAPPPGIGETLPDQLKLPSNQIARKMVYEFISAGGGFINNAWQNAPKLVSIAVQASTGWVIDCVADLSPTSLTNSGSPQDYAYERQGPSDATSASTDHVTAYNYLRQLWRLKRGECIIFLPNGDSYPALIQVEEFESPKPFAASYRSDTPSSWQPFVTLKIREDI